MKKKVNKHFLITLFFLYSLPSVKSQNITLENIYTFSRLYGYVRYFHPSDEAQDIDWEKFAVLGCREVEKCQNKEELKAKLTELFNPIAPSLKLFFKYQEEEFNLSEITPNDTNGFNPISWQHRGLNTGAFNKTYASTRLNKSNVVYQSPTLYKTIGFRIQKSFIAGKEFKFTAKLKREVGACNGILMVNDKDGVRTTSSYPAVDNYWKEIILKGRFDTLSNKAFLGFVLSGEGTLKLDDISLCIKDNNQWKYIYKECFDGLQGDKGKLFSVTSKNLKVDIVNGNCILKTCDSIKYQPPRKLYERKVNVGEYIKKYIGSGIFCILPLALYGDEENTFPTVNSKDKQHLYCLLDQIKEGDMIAENLYLRLGDIVIIHNMFQHFYPYRYIIEDIWGKNIIEAFKWTYNDQNLIDFRKTLQRLLTTLKDGHIRVISIEDYKEGLYMPPVDYVLIENQLVIKNTLPEFDLNAGDVIQKIDGVDAETYFNDAKSYFSGSDRYTNYLTLLTALRGHRDSEVSFDINTPEGIYKNIKIARRIRIGKFQEFVAEGEKSYEMYDDVWYINMFSDNTNLITIDKIKNAKALIIDARGSFYKNDWVRKHLFKKRKKGHPFIISYRQTNYPDGIELIEKDDNAKEMISKIMHNPQKPFIKAKVYLLINERTVSASETFVGLTKYLNNEVITIGQSTAGANGSINLQLLPGGITVQWTGGQTSFSNGSRFHAIGISPDIEVEWSKSDIYNEKDPYIEKALQLIQDELLINLKCN